MNYDLHNTVTLYAKLREPSIFLPVFKVFMVDAMGLYRTTYCMLSLGSVLTAKIDNHSSREYTNFF